jgi:hypothetical protein
MSSIVLNESYTNFTESFDQINVKTNDNGTSSIYRHTYHRKKLSNLDQLDHIVHFLVVENNFIMSNINKNCIKFTCSTNPETFYNYYPRTIEFEKVTEHFITNL